MTASLPQKISPFDAQDTYKLHLEEIFGLLGNLLELWNISSKCNFYEACASSTLIF